MKYAARMAAGNAAADIGLTYLCWLGYTELLVVCSAVFVHYVAPQAIGRYRYMPSGKHTHPKHFPKNMEMENIKKIIN